MCFRHVMFKTYQFSTNENKVFKGLVQVRVNDAHVSLQNRLHVQKKMGKEDMNGRSLVLNVRCHFKSLRPKSKPNLHLKSLCLKRLWNSRKPSSHVMEGRGLSLYNKEFRKPKCGPL
jgi:hypothetical protein